MKHVDARTSALAVAAALLCPALAPPAAGQAAGGAAAGGRTSVSSRGCPGGAGVLVERAFAGRARLRVGTELRIGDDTSTPCRAVVVGTFEPPPDPATLTRERPRLLLHLPDLAAITGRTDAVDRFTVTLARPASTTEVDSVAALLRALMPGTQVLAADELAERSSATFRVIQRFHVAIAWITLSASGVFLACLMTLRVQQRRVPVAALRLTGISRRTLFLWLLLEATLISLFGAVAGLGIGYLASDAINAFYQRRYDTALLFSLVGPDATVPALVLAVVLGLGAGAVAATFLLRADPLAEAGR